ncbi:MAG: glycosyltransferase N-terminal domain-containing protein [Chitinophagaceae bacterium]
MHIFFYNVFLWFYATAIRIVALWNPKARLWRDGRKGLLEKLETALASPENGKPGDSKKVDESGDVPTTHDSPLTIWMHCASLGEFEQGRPLLESIRLQYPGCRIVLTFFSPSGYEIRKDYKGADYVCYLPMDSRKNARRFINIFKPSLVLWVKYEYWYYYLAELKRQQVPTLLISGIFRKSQPFFTWYGRLHRYMLDCFTHIFVQNAQSVELLTGIGVKKNVSIGGDTRFDRVITIAEQFEDIEPIKAFCGNHPVIVAGSTWAEDEEEIDHYANTHPDTRFIIAPHMIDEEHLRDIEKLFKYTVRFSKLRESGYQLPVTGNQHPVTCNTLIIDNIGMLSRLYKYATITYVGGGFGEDGIHNILEAAVYGKPVVFGPEYDKYAEAIDLVEAKGAFSVSNALELEQIFNKLMEDNQLYRSSCSAAYDYVYASKGATAMIMEYIQEKRLLTN